MFEKYVNQFEKTEFDHDDEHAHDEERRTAVRAKLGRSNSTTLGFRIDAGPFLILDCEDKQGRGCGVFRRARRFDVEW